jgi:hypothetical protein
VPGALFDTAPNLLQAAAAGALLGALLAWARTKRHRERALELMDVAPTPADTDDQAAAGAPRGLYGKSITACLIYGAVGAAIGAAFWYVGRLIGWIEA